MDAPNMDVLLYCMAISPTLSSDGIARIYFTDWLTDLEGTLNPNILTKLAESSSPTFELYEIDGLTELSAD